ncbi:hypothetical protein CMV_023406 [Castanea mollissima]|uniref:Uncharacterized protein n=1 Tax=Castanea mollissima TaxID=60419 RepID=A0A8J4VIW5_9ROSI|nr:hypothetical protein CMV_023406 [Castanea mollissima]
MEVAQLAVQVNIFDCGGIGIGLCSSHKITDGATLNAFLNTWAAIAGGPCNKLVHPNISEASSLAYFPPCNIWPRIAAPFNGKLVSNPISDDSQGPLLRPFVRLQTILVIEGAGCIGFHTVVQLLNEGFRVSIIDDLDNSVTEAVDRGDLRNKDLEKLFSQTQYVYFQLRVGFTVLD